MKIYPNPARDKFTISGLTSDVNGIELSDIAGKSVYVQQFNSPQKELTINADDFENGIYFLKINSARNTIGKKIVINH